MASAPTALVQGFQSIHAFDHARVHCGNITVNKNHCPDVSRDRKERLLQSLFFESIHQRREAIKAPISGTLEWIFRDSSATGAPTPSLADSGDANQAVDGESDRNGHQVPNQNQVSSACGQPWPFSDFVRWLREGSSTYWIRGKAGSGKSTLMGHIVEDPRTQANLKDRSGESELFILSFFFWRPGAGLQNSTLGLLRSLLFQVLELAGDNDLILPDLSWNRAQPWTQERLIEVVVNVIRAATGYCFCIFIDGLDEYSGQPDDLLHLRSKLDDLERVKCCVSSRPEVAYIQAFAQSPALRLESLNRKDLESFVTARLQRFTLEKKQQLIREVVQKAKGVFLWVTLVTRALEDGARNQDDSDLLFQCLHDMPSEMDELFSRMIRDIPKRYRSSLSFYLQLMRLGEDCKSYPNAPPDYEIRQIPHITAARLKGDFKCYERFARECDETEFQITSRSAGLLEVGSTRLVTLPEYDETAWNEADYKFAVPLLQDDRGLMSNEQGTRARTDRQRLENSALFPRMLLYEVRHVTRVHRSAYDYVFSSNKVPWVGFETNDGETIEKILQGFLQYFAVAPSYGRRSHSRLESIISSVGKLAAKDELASALVFNFLDGLRDLVARMDEREFDRGEYIFRTTSRGGGLPTSDIAFRLACVGMNRSFNPKKAFGKVHDYLMGRINLWAEPSHGDFLLSPLNTQILLRSAQFTIDSPGDQGSNARMRFKDWASTFRTLVAATLEPVTQFIGLESHELRNVRTFVCRPFDHKDSPTWDYHWDFDVISCRWPSAPGDSALVHGDAFAIFNMATVLLKLMEEAGHISVGRSVSVECAEAVGSLEQFARSLDIFWSCEVYGEDERYTLYRVVIQLAYRHWQTLFDYTHGKRSLSDIQSYWLQDTSAVRVVCFPFGYQCTEVERLHKTRSCNAQSSQTLAEWDGDKKKSLSRAINAESVDDDVESLPFSNSSGASRTEEDFLEPIPGFEVLPSVGSRETLLTMFVKAAVEYEEPANSFYLLADAQLISWMEALVTDIKNNHTLSATEQLLAMACVKTEITRIKDYIRIFVDEQPDETCMKT